MAFFLNHEISTRELKKISRKELNTANKEIVVLRTLPFEYLEKNINLFSMYQGSSYTFYFSDYDTSLNQIQVNNCNDMYLLWMDWRLYMTKMEPKSLLEWLKSRLAEIDSYKPILINNWPTFWELDEKQYAANVSKRGWIYEFNYLLETLKNDFSNLEIIDINLLASQIGMSSYDERNDELSNYPLSNQLTLQTARHMALNLMPSMFEPKLKAIVVDLDNTLYSGVLGEDGIEGIILTEAHYQLHRVLKRMKENGILLAISSKNDEQDVFDMFTVRKDFPLQQDDFTFIEANWHSKAENIQMMAHKFNFDSSAMLFIDDNPAEIALVKEQIPSIHTLMADATGKETVHRLLNYPYLYSRKKDDFATLRQKDILANQKRIELANKAGNSNSYLASLQMKVVVFDNNKEHTQRVYEMGQKTNQFNLALQRFTEGDTYQKESAKNYHMFTVTLSDMLNDSGVIGSYIAQLKDKKAVFEEVLFSCRALGRKVEDAALLLILESLQQQEITEIEFETIEGPRNKPALDWYNSIYISSNIADIIKGLKDKLSDYPAEVSWNDERNN